MPYPTGTPVDEQILDDVKDTLETIATPSYHTDVAYVSRYDPENGLEIHEYPALLIGPASIAWDDATHGLLSGVMSFTVRGFVEEGADAHSWAGRALELDTHGARIIGGGAGTTEAHTASLARALGSLHPSVPLVRPDTELDDVR